MIVMSEEKARKKNKAYAPWYSEKETYLSQGNQVPFLKFACMEKLDWVNLVFSTRQGGVSQGHLSSLNLGWNRGEARENVQENYKRVCQELGEDYRNLVLSDQIHETQVQYVDETLTSGESMEKRLKGVDGLYTDKKHLILATSYADCVPLFFVDPENHWIASSHSGWRGTVKKMGECTIKKLVEKGSKPDKLIAVIGPSICQDCYEVGEDVAEEFFKAYSTEQCRDILEKGRKTEEGEQKYQLDLWAANWHQLKTAGMLPENIHISGVCTCCNSDLLFSHRASGGKRGNLNGFLYLL